LALQRKGRWARQERCLRCWRESWCLCACKVRSLLRRKDGLRRRWDLRLKQRVGKTLSLRHGDGDRRWSRLAQGRRRRQRVCRRRRRYSLACRIVPRGPLRGRECGQTLGRFRRVCSLRRLRWAQQRRSPLSPLRQRRGRDAGSRCWRGQERRGLGRQLGRSRAGPRGQGRWGGKLQGSRWRGGPQDRRGCG
jgi:hypothetical protein